MERSVQTEAELLEELYALRTRVTELEQSEAALQQEHHIMDEFLRFASHQLRTPLTTINGNIQLAKRRLQSMMLDEQFPEEVLAQFDPLYEMLSRAERQVHVQNDLLDTLLDTARLQANRFELHKEAINLTDLVRTTIEELRSTTLNRQLELDISPVAPICVYADPKRIAQVLTSYVTHAMRYSTSNSPIRIHLEIRDHNHAALCVRNEGPGIPNEELERIWERSYQLPGMKILSGSSTSFGPGLYSSKTIIERHGGHAGITNIPSQGSTFWLALPLIENDIP